jgi:hypothetical protein
MNFVLIPSLWASLKMLTAFLAVDEIKAKSGLYSCIAVSCAEVSMVGQLMI